MEPSWKEDDPFMDELFKENPDTAYVGDMNWILDWELQMVPDGLLEWIKEEQPEVFNQVMFSRRKEIEDDFIEARKAIRNYMFSVYQWRKLIDQSRGDFNNAKT